MDNRQASFPLYSENGAVSQLNDPSEALGLFVNRDDRSEYIEFNRDGTFLQYERNNQFIGKYTFDQGVLRMALSDGRTAKTFVYGNSFTDQQGRTWVRKEKAHSSTPLAPSNPVSQPARRPVMTWALCMVAVVTFLIVATQWSNIEGWLRKSSPAHYSESSALWEARAFPGTGMTVDLPGDPDKDDSSLPAEDARYLDDMQVYGKDYDNLEYVIMYLLANGAVALDAEEGARGGMEEFEKEPGVVGLDYRITTLNPGHVSISGTCIYLGKVASVEGVVQTKGSRMWAIFTISRTDDAEARAAAKRIISSARFQ